MLVKIEAIPDEGYELENISVEDIFKNDIQIIDQCIKMPASNVNIYATFKKKTYDVTLAKVEHGKVNASKLVASIGDLIQLSVTADEGYELEKITVFDRRGKEIMVVNDIFVMPASDVIVSASFKKIEYNIIVKNSEFGKKKYIRRGIYLLWRICK